MQTYNEIYNLLSDFFVILIQFRYIVQNGLESICLFIFD